MSDIIKKYKLSLIIYISISAILSTSMVANSSVLQKITSVKSVNDYKKIVFGTIVFLVLQSILYFWHQFYGDRLGKKMTATIREEVVIDICSRKNVMSNQESEEQTTDLLSRIPIIENTLINNFLWGIYLICQFFIALGTAFYLNFFLSVGVLILTIPQILTPFIFKSKINKKKEQVSRQLGEFTSNTQDYMRGEKIWKSMNRSNAFRYKMIKSINKLVASEITDIRLQNIVGTLNKFFADLLYFSCWLLGAYFIIQNSLTLPKLIGFAQIVSSISFPLNSATNTITEVIGGKNFYDNLTIKKTNQFYNKVKLLLPNNPIAAQIKNGNLDFLEKPINVTFDMKKRYLIIGETGTGKTTIFNLIFGIIQSKNAEIKRNSSIGYIPQENYIFTGTVADNIILFEKKVDKDALASAIEFSGIKLPEHATISNFSLSGGEKARIGLARAIYQGNKFLLIDELSGSLDRYTQKELETKIFESDLNFAYISHHYDEKMRQQVDAIIEM